MCLWFLTNVPRKSNTLLLNLPQPDNHQPSIWVAARAFQSHLCSTAAQARCSGFNSGPSKFFFQCEGRWCTQIELELFLDYEAIVVALLPGNCNRAIFRLRNTQWERLILSLFFWNWTIHVSSKLQHFYKYHSKLQLLICLYFCCITFIIQLPHQSLLWLCERLHLLHCKSPGDLLRCSMEYLHITS